MLSELTKEDRIRVMELYTGMDRLIAQFYYDDKITAELALDMMRSIENIVKVTHVDEN